MSEQPKPRSGEPDPARSIVGLVVGSSSLLLAVLIYMGSAFDSAFYGYFHLDPLELGFAPLEYTLRSLSLFSPYIVIATVVLILIASGHTDGELDEVVKAIVGGPVRSACRRVLSASPAVGRGDASCAPAVSADLIARERQAEKPASRLRSAKAALSVPAPC